MGRAGCIRMMLDATAGAGMKLAGGRSRSRSTSATDRTATVARLHPPGGEAIRAATVSPAEMLGMAGQIGIIAPGAYADVIAVPGNPLKDITELGQVKFVMHNGQVFEAE